MAVTVHQPPSAVWALADTLLLLWRGHTVYFGSTSHAVEHFAQVRARWRTAFPHIMCGCVGMWGASSMRLGPHPYCGACSGPMPCICRLDTRFQAQPTLPTFCLTLSMTVSGGTCSFPHVWSAAPQSGAVCRRGVAVTRSSSLVPLAQTSRESERTVVLSWKPTKQASSTRRLVPSWRTSTPGMLMNPRRARRSQAPQLPPSCPTRLPTPARCRSLASSPSYAEDTH